ncbi:MAG: translation initiation factor IF-2 [Candidatus Shapirobacteria bacterium]|nr:translation initiation factor IF-2 [Candidatus Shapirobacteria bacterium]MDD4410759.1 translation initiation factor IF-2 [Candidatus Shapirobacteria bacterium]
MTTNIKLTRPPIVAVMGHIDHGKTSLLDKIRSTNVLKKEAGGITQHIASYQAKVTEKNGQTKLITFIDTPGHAAFINMRACGAKATDMVILVISAVEGVMPQTKECLEHIKKCELPFIVALNKMDLENAAPDKVKGQLVELGFTPEEYGGQLAVIPVSAKTGKGIDDLLEMILLNAEILELTADPNGPLEAVIIESRLDKSRGPVASLIVINGTLKPGDIVYSEDISCKVKALIDCNGQQLKEASPSTPVEVLGFEKVPSVSSLVTSVKTASTANKEHKVLLESTEENPKLKVILKADVKGTLEALENSFNDDVIVISCGIGAVSDNDVFMAEAAKAQIFAFNVSTPKHIQQIAEASKVRIFESRIIYEIIEDIQNQVLHLLEPTIDETIVGEGLIKAEFKIDKVRISGVQCIKGEISKGDLIHLKRDGKIIKDTKVEGIHQGKNIIDKLKSGNDCGMTFKPYVDFKVGDAIIAYKN